MTDIVIIAFNNLDITTRAVGSALLHGPLDRRIIFVDNASTDIGFDALRELLSELGHVVIRLPENVGPYGAANAGIAKVTSEKFIFMCNDAALYPGTADKLLSSVSQEHPVVGATEIFNDKYRPASSLSLPSTLIPGVCFTCFAGNTAVVREIGDFDSSFKLTFGDTDWEQRYADSGRSYVLDTGAVMFHGRSVGRKRTGISFDMQIDRTDHLHFLNKWAGRPDVCAKHPLEDQTHKRAFLEREWLRGEQ